MYDYETTWKQTRKVGNATLFNQNTEYQNWKGQADSCTLIYTGKLGSGKSVLLANIVDNLNLYIQSKNVVVAYFFCRHDSPKSLKAWTVIGSLARQLLRTIPDLTIAAELLDETSLALDFERIFSLLQRALPPNCKAYFILDGLDECDYAEGKALIQQLRKLQEIFTLLLCVSFRLEPNNALIWGSEQFTATIITFIPNDNPDIEAFTRSELESCIESKKLVIGNPALILEIQDALLEKSQGMFLWVALQIKSLCAMKTDDAIRQALADLPKDLSETFSRILRRSEGLGKPYQRLILELVTVAYRPLTTEELQEALSVVPGDAVWNPAKLLNDIYSTLACCGSLVTVDEEELTIRLVHHSVKQFLLSGFKDSTNMAFTVDSAKRKMADIIVTYLNYGVFETQLSTVVVPPIMTGSAPSRIIRSTLGSSSSVRSLALKLLKSRTRPDYNISKTLAESSKLFSHCSVDEFRFYAYAKSYWLQHAFSISEQEPVMCNLLLRLFEGKLETKDDIGRTPLSWAARYGHEALVKLLLEKGAELETKDEEYGQTPLSWAARNEHEAVVKLLLEKGAKLETKDDIGRTPLSWAAEKGHEAVVKLLLEKGAKKLQ
jgi:ankyrin repeat domain-containing protein 50